MRIHYFQHVEFEGLGCINDWIIRNGFHLSVTKFYDAIRFPNIEEIDWLIVMGGPMSVYEENLYPWLKGEKEFIRLAIAKEKVVIGICLGAQLLAEVLGAKVYPGKNKEIGWFPLHLEPEAYNNNIFIGIPEGQIVFHWHGDTFDIPKGAIHLASSEATVNQAFIFKNKALALQFHFEANEGVVDKMLLHAGNELIKSKYIHTVDEINKNKDLIKINNEIMFNILDNLNKVDLLKQ